MGAVSNPSGSTRSNVYLATVFHAYEYSLRLALFAVRRAHSEIAVRTTIGSTLLIP